MSRIAIIKLSVIIAAFCSIVLLSFVSTTSPGGKTPKVMPPVSEEGISLDQQVANARRNLNSNVAANVIAIESSIRTNRDPIERGNMYDSLSKFLGQNKEYVLAAYFAEQKAINNNGSGSDWEQAGERYTTSAGFQKDQNTVPALLDAAMRCFNKALELEPKNLDAKVGLGMCIVQGTNDPMKGIGLLLEVVKEDSTNVNAQLALADFSVQRNAPDKAIQRYKNALALRPQWYALHVSIGDLYLQMGDTVSAVGNYEKYCEKETDPVMKNEIENVIRSLQHKK